MGLLFPAWMFPHFLLYRAVSPCSVFFSSFSGKLYLQIYSKVDEQWSWTHFSCPGFWTDPGSTWNWMSEHNHISFQVRDDMPGLDCCNRTWCDKNQRYNCLHFWMMLLFQMTGVMWHVLQDVAKCFQFQPRLLILEIRVYAYIDIILWELGHHLCYMSMICFVWDSMVESLFLQNAPKSKTLNPKGQYLIATSTNTTSQG